MKGLGGIPGISVIFEASGSARLPKYFIELDSARFFIAHFEGSSSRHPIDCV